MNPPYMIHNQHGYHNNHTASMASSSSNPYPDLSQLNTQLPVQYQHNPAAQYHSQSMPPPSSTQWHQATFANPPPEINHLHAPQIEPFSTSSWSNSNQMHGMAAIGGFGMPLLSQQMIQDALALSAPVGHADETLLLQALVDSLRKKDTYKDALNALHGKNGHSASLWKDYYLDHKDRLDKAISVYLNPPRAGLQTIKKPSPSAYKQESSPARVIPKRQVSPDQPVHLPQPPTAKRSTINSITGPAPVFDNRLPAPNAEIQIPDPPSRSPTPPTIIVPHWRKGNKYTPEDQQFFLKFIAWRLKEDSNLTRNDLCALLAEKAPHHTALSWTSYWSNHHDIPDKILAAAKGDERGDERHPDSGRNERGPSFKRPKYRDSSSEEENDIDDSDVKSESEEDSDLEDGHGPIQSLPESEMGVKGGPFTDADLYVTAKYIASFPNFEEATGRERWDPYSERYPQRSAKSWAGYYNKYESALKRLAKRMKRQGRGVPNEPSPIRTQYARPSWAQKPKRRNNTKHDSGDDEDNDKPSRNKRRRGDER